MQFYSYRAYAEHHEGAIYFGTIADAHKLGKDVESVYRCNVRICLIDIAADKAGMLQILNNGGPHKADPDNVKVLRTWNLTARGGLQEITE